MNIFYFNYTELNQKCSSLRQKQRYLNTTTITHTKTTQFVIMAGRCGPAHGIPKPNKESFKKSVIFRGGTLWNLLPGEVRNLPTLSDFKKYTKQLQINRLR